MGKNMEPRLYIVMRRDLWDMNPGKGMAQAAHAQSDFDAHLFPMSIPDAQEFQAAVMAWREDRSFGTTLVLHEPLDTMSKISMNVAHWGFVTDPTYPYRNHYGEVFTRSEVTCMWVFVYTSDEAAYMRQLIFTNRRQPSLQKVAQGISPGEITIVTSGRKAGKSVILDGKTFIESKWHKELLAKGWHPVMGTQYFHLNWAQCHRECKEIFGEENYTWTGSVFWFKNKEDILVYKLTFSR